MIAYRYASRHDMSRARRALIVGGGVFVIGIILLLVGMSRLTAETLMPNRTIQQIQSDVRVAKGQVREDYAQQRAA